MSEPQIPIEQFTLDNGLRVVLSPDPLVPISTVNMWVSVGSCDEEPGRTGLAHLFEHMMFQGSPNVAKAEHMRLIESVGGRTNASTTLHRTNYFEVAPSHATELLLWLESDRLGGLLGSLGQEELDNQRDVVKNEKRQRVDNQPYGSAFEYMLDAVFPEGHPYHHTPIGSMDDLDAASLDDVRTFFRAHYVPNKTVLTVAGDIDPAATRAYIEEAFGPIPRGDPPPRRPATRPPGGLGTRREITERVPLPRLYATFPAPGAVDPALTAADIGVAVLAGNDGGASKGSRLYRRLVHERALGQDIGVTGVVLPDASLIVISMMVRPDADVREAEDALGEAIASLATEPPTEEELARARAGAQRGLLDRLSSTISRADLLSECATIYGDATRARSLVDEALAVTADHVVQAASQIFVPDNRAMLIYLPEEAA